jgi:hypothetical protein
MAIPILPIIGAISNLASTTWEIYRKATEAKKSSHDKQAQEALLRRIEDLEDSYLQQAGVISELSDELKQFAEAVQDEIEEHRKREARLRATLWGAAVISLTSLTISVLVWMK